MVTDNNGNYTPPIHGDPRGSLGTGGMGWSEPKSVVMSMPPTRPEAITSQVELQGDIKAAGTYVPLVRQQMQAMHQQNISNLEIMDRPVNLGDGKVMLCQRRFNADRAIINVPGNNKMDFGPLHLNFDPSVMTEFEQTIYDKNHGIPLFFNNFAGAQISNNGLSFGNENDIIEMEGNAASEMYCEDQHGISNGRTVFIAWNKILPFESVDTGEGGTIQVPGGGIANLYVFIMSPINIISCNMAMYQRMDNYIAKTVLKINGNNSTHINEFPLQSNTNNILAIRKKGYDLVNDVSGGITSNGVCEFFYNGTKINEETVQDNSWGTYFPNNRSKIEITARVSGKSFMSLKQKMLYAAHLDDSQIREATDNLASKWGF